MSDHFRAGEAIAVYEWDNAAPVRRVGTIDATPADDKITVTFTAVWVPGASTWNGMYQGRSAVTTRQKTYAYIASADRTLDALVPPTPASAPRGLTTEGPMTTSQYGGLVAWDTAGREVARSTCSDTAHVNDGLRNNVAHHVDEQSQTLVALISQSSSAFESWQTPTAAAGFPSPVADYDGFLHPRPNGKPPVFVVDLMGATAATPAR